MPLPTNLDLVRKIVWSHVRSSHPSQEFDEAFSEACLAYLEAAASFDPSKGAESTFMWTVIRNHLINQSKGFGRMMEHEILLTDEEWLQEPGPPLDEEILARMTFVEMLQVLSPDAKAICALVLNPPQELDLTLPPKKCRGEIVRYLREVGWSWGRIWKALGEVKQQFA